MGLGPFWSIVVLVLVLVSFCSSLTPNKYFNILVLVPLLVIVVVHCHFGPSPSCLSPETDPFWFCSCI